MKKGLFLLFFFLRSHTRTAYTQPLKEIPYLPTKKTCISKYFIAPKVLDIPSQAFCLTLLRVSLQRQSSSCNSLKQALADI